MMKHYPFVWNILMLNKNPSFLKKILYNNNFKNNVMKNLLVLSAVLMLAIFGCKKNEDFKPIITPKIETALSENFDTTVVEKYCDIKRHYISILLKGHFDSSIWNSVYTPLPRPIIPTIGDTITNLTYWDYHVYGYTTSLKDKIWTIPDDTTNVSGLCTKEQFDYTLYYYTRYRVTKQNGEYVNEFEKLTLQSECN